ncbi:MAG: hypothetical protein JEZ02_18805 [Desulfatibacillum sp.]|nr:hypothetical protein [Desulfatibacillum sp.]
MRIAEVIQVRAFNGNTLAQAIEEARGLFLPDRPEALEKLELWIRNDLETDICVVLSWASDRSREVKSKLGLELADFFSEYGWVLHSVWGIPRETGLKGA